MKKLIFAASAAGMLLALTACGSSSSGSIEDSLATTTPIKHLVVIYGENISFDHYFATYPTATNPAGEPKFTAAVGTPAVNGLSGALLTANPNSTNVGNGAGAANPFRLDRVQAATADQGHNYTPEQQASDFGAQDLFPEYTGHAGSGGSGAFNTTGLVMAYFDGNTVTAMWNYAQHFAMSDNSYSDQYGPSTPGAINLIAGQTNGFTIGASSRSTYYVNDTQGGLTLINDVDPAGDSCSSTTDNGKFSGKNIGDLLNSGGITWGWFEGGFNLGLTNGNGTTGCARSTFSDTVNAATADYIPHHEPFQYYTSTANPTHVRPTSMSVVGTASDGGANHQYDIQDFFAAVNAGNFPSVTFLKASAYQDAHAGYSDPLDEQTFVVEVVNFLEQQPDWANTAVIIAYDDSDGWYDHQLAAVGNASFDATADQVTAAGKCGVSGVTPQAVGVAGTGPVNGRCGPGMRQPFLVISPWAKSNYVDHTLITQASIIKFIEDNWLSGKRIGGGSFDATTGSINALFNFSATTPNAALYLDPNYGTLLTAPPKGTPNDAVH